MVSPGNELPEGLVIAYSRISRPGELEINLSYVAAENIESTEMVFQVVILE